MWREVLMTWAIAMPFAVLDAAFLALFVYGAVQFGHPWYYGFIAYVIAESAKMKADNVMLAARLKDLE